VGFAGVSTKIMARFSAPPEASSAWSAASGGPPAMNGTGRMPNSGNTFLNRYSVPP